LKFETFFYKISNIVDDMQITENVRRVNLYLKKLPEDIAKAIAITAPTNENELYLKLKSISQYYKNNVLDGEVNTVEVKEKEDSKNTQDPTETFETELDNALCCALEQRNFTPDNTRGGGQRYQRGRGNFRGNYRGNYHEQINFRGNYRGNFRGRYNGNNSYRGDNYNRGNNYSGNSYRGNYYEQNNYRGNN